MSLAELTPAQKEELVVSLSALLLQDSGVDMSAENLEAVIKVGVCVYVCMWGDGGLGLCFVPCVDGWCVVIDWMEWVGWMGWGGVLIDRVMGVAMQAPLFSYFIMITRRESTTMYLHTPFPSQPPTKPTNPTHNPLTFFVPPSSNTNEHHQPTQPTIRIDDVPFLPPRKQTNTRRRATRWRPTTRASSPR